MSGTAAQPAQPQYDTPDPYLPPGSGQPAAQYMRQLRLVVGDASGKALDLSQQRISFVIRRATVQTPNSLTARVYNLSGQTASQVSKEFTQVLVQAGYAGNYGTIFRGTVKNFARGKETPTDTYLDIQAADSDLGYNFGVANTTINAGYSHGDVGSVIAKALPGVSPPQVPPAFPVASFPRGRAFFGMARDVARNLAATTGTTWSIQDGVLQYVPNNAYLSGDVVVLNSATGLIGMPQQTIDGIVVRCLLNPFLRVGRAVQIAQHLINQFEINLDYAAVQNQPSIQGDGFYRVVAFDHIGDTRGNDWYTNFVCVGLNAPLSIGLAQQGQV